MSLILYAGSQVTTGASHLDTLTGGNYIIEGAFLNIDLVQTAASIGSFFLTFQTATALIFSYASQAPANSTLYNYLGLWVPFGATGITLGSTETLSVTGQSGNGTWTYSANIYGYQI